MKKSREETARTRERILRSASRAFRSGGFGGVSVKDLMNEAGLTHGAFYAHFPSKDVLMGEACADAFKERAEGFHAMLDANPGNELDTFVRYYLRPEHVSRPELGCPVPSLAGEAARGPDEVKQVFTRGVSRMLERLQRAIPGDDAEREAIAFLAEAVGAIVLARAVSDPDLQERILDACRTDLTSH